MDENKTNNKNILFNVFKRFESGPAQFVVAMFVVTVILLLTIGIPILTLFLNYNRNLEELAYQNESQSLNITDNTLLSLQDALSNSNHRILELEMQVTKQESENLYLKSLLYFLSTNNDFDLSILKQYENLCTQDILPFDFNLN